MGGRRAEWGRPPASGHCDTAAAGSRASPSALRAWGDPQGGTGGRSGTSAAPGAGGLWLIAQFPAPLRDASAAAGVCAARGGTLKRRARVLRGWSRSSPRPCGALQPRSRWLVSHQG
ncbi:hypothetical protein GCM10010267_08080 [Streptomyces griseorubens]|nr:hypothetical protein GCM10010267_08080 [Streptomyces griseorubens]